MSLACKYFDVSGSALKDLFCSFLLNKFQKILQLYVHFDTSNDLCLLINHINALNHSLRATLFPGHARQAEGECSATASQMEQSALQYMVLEFRTITWTRGYSVAEGHHHISAHKVVSANRMDSWFWKVMFISRHCSKGRSARLTNCHLSCSFKSSSSLLRASPASLIFSCSSSSFALFSIWQRAKHNQEKHL